MPGSRKSTAGLLTTAEWTGRQTAVKAGLLIMFISLPLFTNGSAYAQSQASYAGNRTASDSSQLQGAANLTKHGKDSSAQLNRPVLTVNNLAEPVENKSRNTILALSAIVGISLLIYLLYNVRTP
ncbi:MAG: hypothetical protein V4543_03610 [Bacteroidota bacterium]